MEPFNHDIPLGLKSITTYVQRAREVQDIDPIVSYYAFLCAVENGVKQMSTLPPPEKSASQPFLLQLLGHVEKMKPTVEMRPDFADLHSSRKRVENMAARVFLAADDEDRKGTPAMKTSQNFLVAACFFEVLNSMPVPSGSPPDGSPAGMPREDIDNKIKYAKWRAVEISRAIRENRLPSPPTSFDKQDPAAGSPTSPAMAATQWDAPRGDNSFPGSASMTQHQHQHQHHAMDTDPIPTPSLSASTSPNNFHGEYAGGAGHHQQHQGFGGHSHGHLAPHPGYGGPGSGGGSPSGSPSPHDPRSDYHQPPPPAQQQQQQHHHHHHSRHQQHQSPTARSPTLSGRTATSVPDAFRDEPVGRSPVIMSKNFLDEEDDFSDDDDPADMYDPATLAGIERLARHAASAVQYADIPTARARLEEALRMVATAEQQARAAAARRR
ncbi:hypothetical protein H696_04052 [Fonticula alba]|uniref:Vta1/callose synthase N-terminal domain-containing protein n=1 Tax=Fonticula alba TaxID=691883 RepID=A0A058Z5S4_FONAL|nr:hypothetical protein H696_04052 [Fonticula alba]KCV69634.1 hypothetical protein H696_04052 [Fonticula alba]|eukprot:XP_009496199.1 hypothetical protein H696_04052 [Fonticula alba]